MKILIVPDSFKESLSASDVAAAIGRGVLSVCPSTTLDLCPMADGGEGTVAAMVAATGGRLVTVDVFDPLGAPIRASFGLLGHDSDAGLPGEVGLSGAVARGGSDVSPGPGSRLTAVVEMAAASGLDRVPPERRDPRRTTTFGTGQLIMAALDAGATDIVIGVGGSATVDGGVGAAQAMGVVFIDTGGRPCVCGLAGGGLADIQSIDVSDRDPRLADVRIRVACDVVNPLIGSNGAAAVYGPQKGATPEIVGELEAGLAHLADVVRRELGIDIATIPGGGAAGGLAAGLLAFANATLERGVELVSRCVELEKRMADADLCITGEGRLDSQSLHGKTAVGVAEMAAKMNVPTICIPGQADADAPQDIFRSILPLVRKGVTVRKAMADPDGLLQERAAEAVRQFLSE